MRTRRRSQNIVYVGDVLVGDDAPAGCPRAIPGWLVIKVYPYLSAMPVWRMP